MNVQISEKNCKNTENFSDSKLQNDDNLQNLCPNLRSKVSEEKNCPNQSQASLNLCFESLKMKGTRNLPLNLSFDAECLKDKADLMLSQEVQRK